MSGIVGIACGDGRPVRHELLCRMTDAIAYRGPDDRRTWIGPSAGLGHTLLRTTTESVHERQPASLDNSVWITADVRLDDRLSLISGLQAEGRTAAASCDDAQLILHAYHAWGEKCVAHLLGDFGFAIWDGRVGRLFCARDHFGVKPFYYAHVDGGLVFSNTLDCIRLHPHVRDELNEAAIGDFLAFGYNQDPATTAFTDILRIPAAHTLVYENDRVRLQRYWIVPTDGRVRYRNEREYVDGFTDVLRAAVADRMRTDRVSVWMSGGLDSTSIAAVAQRHLIAAEEPGELCAHTIVYDTLFSDRERDYSQLAAAALGIRSLVFQADAYRPFERWDALRSLPEPTGDPFAVMRIDQLKEVAAVSRVLLSGEGGDEVFWSSFLLDLIDRMPVGELSKDVWRCVIRGRRPPVGVRSKVQRLLRSRSGVSGYPPWVKGSFANRIGVRERQATVDRAQPATTHPLRAEAHRRLSTAPWSWYFESGDPGVTRLPVETRFPFLDLRVVKYLLAIPPLPWCVDKHILRVAMQGALPEAVRLRPKTALAGDPLSAHLARGQNPWSDPFVPARKLAEWVDVPSLSQLRHRPAADAWEDVRPLCLNYWLNRLSERPSLIQETS